MNRKTFVLDTNVLLHDPEAFFKFPHSNVIIPLTVIEELDKMKRLPSELGKNSRSAVRHLDEIKKLQSGDLHHGVRIDNGAMIRVEMQIKTNYPQSISLNLNDNKILLAAYFLQEKGEKVVFLSKDFGSRVKAVALGLEAEDYENLKVSYDNLQKGIRHFEIPKTDIDHFYKDGRIAFKDIKLSHNEYCVLTSLEHTSAVAKYDQQKRGA